MISWQLYLTSPFTKQVKMEWSDECEDNLKPLKLCTGTRSRKTRSDPERASLWDGINSKKVPLWKFHIAACTA
jgi:hypothetical protein